MGETTQISRILMESLGEQVKPYLVIFTPYIVIFVEWIKF